MTLWIVLSEIKKAVLRSEFTWKDIGLQAAGTLLGLYRWPVTKMMSAPLWDFHLQKQVWKRKDAVVLFCFSRGVQRNDYAHFFFKWISVHWYQTFQRKMCLFTSVLRPSSQSLQGSATTLGSIDGFLRPPPPFTVSHPTSLFYANEVGREALCELQLRVRLRSWCRQVLCCVPVPLGFAALYIHSVWMKRERKAEFECRGGRGCLQIRATGSFVWYWVP